MPYYDLKCVKCKHEFRAKATVAEREGGLLKCPECASGKLEPIFKSLQFSVAQKQAECPNTASCGLSCPHARAR